MTSAQKLARRFRTARGAPDNLQREFRTLDVWVDRLGALVQLAKTKARRLEVDTKVLGNISEICKDIGNWAGDLAISSGDTDDVMVFTGSDRSKIE
jgi:hypothetical protein